MGVIAERVKQQIVLGLNNGGRIPMPLIEAEIGWCMDRLYNASEMVVMDLDPIAEVVDQTEYALASNITANDARIVRMHTLFRNRPSVTDTLTIVNPGIYRIDNVLADTATPTPSLEIIFDPRYPSNSALDQLTPRAIMGFTDELYIPQMQKSDAEEAVTALVRHRFLSQTKKQWGGTPGEALAELQVFNAAVSRIKHKVLRGSTSHELTMRRQSFI